MKLLIIYKLVHKLERRLAILQLEAIWMKGGRKLGKGVKKSLMRRIKLNWTKDWKEKNGQIIKRSVGFVVVDYLQPILDFPFSVIESVKMKGSLSICHFINTWGQTKIWNLQRTPSNTISISQIKHLFIREERKRMLYNYFMLISFPPFYSHAVKESFELIWKSMAGIERNHSLIHWFTIHYARKKEKDA